MTKGRGTDHAFLYTRKDANCITISVHTWCGYGDLNPNALRHENLNLACLPIPSYPQIYKNEKK